MKHAFYLSLLASLFLTACNKNYEKPPDTKNKYSATSNPEPPKRQPYTKEKWREDFLKPFHVSGVKTNDDGTTEYSICQNSAWSEEKKCKNGYFAFGERDAFRKLDHLKPSWTAIDGISSTSSYIGIYIAAVECKQIKMLMAPVVNGKTGWLFMKKVSLLADGDIAFERSFDTHEIKRDNGARWIHERADFILTDEEISQLRKYSSASQHNARITGDKGYITISKEAINHFNKDVADILQIHDDIKSAHAAGGGPVCTTVEEMHQPASSKL